ncbi:MAG TPA: tetratricopeptide repeat protein [Kofleriaceae bacterium]|nr:tetratricopeptide repeat protein [Kofleriaceae bacterium]
MANDDRDHDQDFATARQAFAEGDLAHALLHIGCALAGNPMHPERMALMNQIVGAITQRPDAMKLIELDDPSVVEIANRSYVLAWMGQWVEALDLVTDAAEMAPHVPYLLWAEWWMQQRGALQAMTWDQFKDGILVDLMKISVNCPPNMDKDDPRLANVQASARIIGLIRDVHGNQPFVWIVASGIARRLGQAGEALAMAEHAYKMAPGWNTATTIARALMDQGKLDDARKWFHKAMDHDKEGIAAYLDCGDMMLDAGRLDDAIAEYERVLKAEPDHEWAVPSLKFAEYKKYNDPNRKLALLRMTEAGDGNERARELAQRLDPPQAWVTYLPRPADASSNALDDIFQQMFQNPASHHGSTVKLKLSFVESPSVVAAFWLQMEMWGPQVGFDYQVDTIQQPDPRQPKTQVPYNVWAWDGTQPKPALPRPDPQVVKQLHLLAGEPFALDIWAPRAQKLARELGPNALQHLLAALTFPPKPPGSNWRVLTWTQRAQVATTLVIAHLDEGWNGSLRQKALYSLLYGPTDWTTSAAIVVLGYLARTDATIRAEVLQAFAWMQSIIPKQGFTCWEYPLACVWLSMPGLDDVTKKRLEQWKEAILDNKTGSTTVHMCELEAKRFDQAAEMQKAQAAQQQIAQGGGGDPDPTVFPGQRVARLSDYVKIMKGMQAGNFMGALGAYGLDMMSYSQVATAWGQKLAADPVLNAKFAAMMAG